MRQARPWASLLKRTWATPALRCAPAGKGAGTTASVASRRPSSTQPISSSPRAVLRGPANSPNRGRDTPSGRTARPRRRHQRTGAGGASSSAAGSCSRNSERCSRFSSRLAELTRPCNMTRRPPCSGYGRRVRPIIAGSRGCVKDSCGTRTSSLVRRCPRDNEPEGGADDHAEQGVHEISERLQAGSASRHDTQVRKAGPEEQADNRAQHSTNHTRSGFEGLCPCQIRRSSEEECEQNPPKQETGKDARTENQGIVDIGENRQPIDENAEPGADDAPGRAG